MKNHLAIAFLLISIQTFSQNQEIGKSFIQSLLQEKNYAKAYTFFDETVKSQMSESVLKDTEQQLNSQLGNFNKIIEFNNESDTYFFYSDFENMKLDIKITFNENSKIIGFFFTPHKEFKTQNSLGNDLNIKSNNVELKGTLLIPNENNLKKLVVFVHGSGPQDRNETIFENKPFKDIAENLFQKGVASYRFDKRTLSNLESFNDKITIDDEVTSDVINIVNYFKQEKEYADYEIIVLGHSLGANLLPRIANQTNQISKIILLAGNARPMDKLIIEQYEYLYKQSPTKELQTATNSLKEQVAFLNSKEFNVNTPKEKLPLNLPSYYWKSILDYNPLQEVQKVKIPILILQGERDYQVTMQDFNLWKNTLKTNKTATFISYLKLNHLFISGESPSTPKEYSIKGSVDEKVINDIKDFISTK